MSLDTVEVNGSSPFGPTISITYERLTATRRGSCPKWVTLQHSGVRDFERMKATRGVSKLPANGRRWSRKESSVYGLLTRD